MNVLLNFAKKLGTDIKKQNKLQYRLPSEPQGGRLSVFGWHCPGHF